MRISGVAMLLAAALIGRTVDWPALIFLGVGVAGAAFWNRNTAIASSIAFIGAFFALLVPVAAVRTPMAAMLWLIWLPALIAGLANSSNEATEASARTSRNEARLGVAGIIAAVAFGAGFYKFTFTQNLQQSSALFVGVPAIIAITVVFAVSPRSAIGVACKAMTVGLLVSLIFFNEGFLCIAMSAPIFFAIAIGIACLASKVSGDSDEPTRFLRSSVLVLAVLPLTLEGTSEFVSLDRNETVVAERIVQAPPEEIERALRRPPRFERALPLPLMAGFPRPIVGRLENDGTRWVIQMRGGETRFDGTEPKTGELTLDLETAAPGLLRWRARSDSSHMTHFLSWRAATVEWQQTATGDTHVKWTLEYRRGLDPAWYFGPWERYVAGVAADYLIDAVATP